MAAEQLLDVLSALQRATRRAIERPPKLASLTGAQLELVRLVRRNPGISVTDAAAELRLAPNTVSTLVRHLTDERVLMRTVDATDRRVARLDLPPGLRREVEAWRDRRVDAIDAALAALTPDERAKLEAALPALSRLAAEVSEMTAVVCRGVRHSFGDHVAVDGVDLEVDEGEVFGLLGPNGAGKTTLIRLMNTLLPLQEGSIAVLGHDVRRAKMRIRRGLGYVPQQLSIEGALTGRENVEWFARLFDVPRSERKARVANALDAMALTDAADRLAGTYSGGMVRRLELAQALVNRPALLILDEPTVGLDPVARDSVWQRVEDLRGATGMTVLLTTHYMEEADALCDRIALLHLGKVRAEGTPEELKDSVGIDAIARGRLPPLHRRQPRRRQEGRTA